MSILRLCAPDGSAAAILLAAALRRSFTAGQVSCSPDAAARGAFSVFADCRKCPAEALRAAVRRGGKILLTGCPEPDILPRIGLKSAPEMAVPPEAALAAHCFTEPFHESAGRIRYGDHPLALESPVRDRAFCRYDYAEWNNLGFGAVRAGGDFGVEGGVGADGAAVLAAMSMTAGGREIPLGPYMTVLDLPGVSILWCARPVGPLDSVEWQVIERFFSDWRAGELPCLPYLLQTPYGANCVVTMRLDCDEAVASARDLFELYQDERIPFSLAVKTGQELGGADAALLRDVRETGGSLLSHSHTHMPNWGRNREEAREDARRSLEWFAGNLPDLPGPLYAVSPFHANSVYAVEALREAGFKGFVGGIIDNDPEFLLGRAGRVPFTEKFLSISQQSMLHGDSFRNQGHCLAAHERAFALQYAGRGIFGYLDHPFSERYQYGWDSAAERRQAHQTFITAMKKCPGTLFWSQEACFAFVERLAAAGLHPHRTDSAESRKIFDGEYRIAYRIRGENAGFGAEPQ
jgi:hypothetical protein